MRLEPELGEELRAEAGQFLIVQFGVRHERLAVKRFLRFSVGDEGEAVVGRRHAGFLDVYPGDVVYE